MSAFKDMVANDIDAVFLNLDEFGSEHDIEGNPVICIIAEDGSLNLQGGTVAAVGQDTMSIYAKCSDLPERRGYGAELIVDGIPYMINTWQENDGISTVNVFIANNS